MSKTYIFMKRKKRSILIITTMVLVTIVLIFGIQNRINQYKILHSYVYSYLQGNHILIGEYSYLERSSVDGISFAMNIKGTKISILSFEMLMLNSDQLDESLEGYLHVISCNPDSISIETGSRILDGKYRVRYMNKEEGNISPIVTNYMFLENDSTSLCLEKLKY